MRPSQVQIRPNPGTEKGEEGKVLPLAKKLLVTVTSRIINQDEVGTENQCKHFPYHENRQEQDADGMCKLTSKVVVSIVKP